MANPYRSTVTIDGTKFDAVSSQVVFTTAKDRAGMPEMGSLKTKIKVWADFHDDKNLPHAAVKKFSVPNAELVFGFIDGYHYRYVVSKASGHVDGQGFACVFIDDRQTFELLPVGTGVEHEIVGPYLVGLRGRKRSRAGARYAPPRPLSRHLEPLLRPQPVRAVVAHHQAVAMQKHMHPTVSVPRVLA